MTHDSHARAQEGRWSWSEKAPDTRPYGDAPDPSGHAIVGMLIDTDQEAGLREVGWFNARGIAARVAEALNLGMGRDGKIQSLAGVLRLLCERTLTYIAAPDDPELERLLDCDAEMRDLARAGLAALEAQSGPASAAAFFDLAGRTVLTVNSPRGVPDTVEVNGRRFVPARPDVIVIEDPVHIRAPVLEGLEPSPHRAGCECQQCWPLAYASGGMAVSAIEAAIPTVKED